MLTRTRLRPHDPATPRLSLGREVAGSDDMERLGTAGVKWDSMLETYLDTGRRLSTSDTATVAESRGRGVAESRSRGVAVSRTTA